MAEIETKEQERPQTLGTDCTECIFFEDTKKCKLGIIEQFKQMSNFNDCKIIDIDGIRVEFDNGWGLLRASNTSPVLVLRFEANSVQELNNIKDSFKDILSKIDPVLIKF